MSKIKKKLKELLKLKIKLKNWLKLNKNIMRYRLEYLKKLNWK